MQKKKNRKIEKHDFLIEKKGNFSVHIFRKLLGQSYSYLHTIGYQSEHVLREKKMCIPGKKIKIRISIALLLDYIYMKIL